MNIILQISFVFTLISSISAQKSLCIQYYSDDLQQIQCDCDSIDRDGRVSISLKCQGLSYVPHFINNVHYDSIELESCSKDLQILDKTFADLNINLLRLRHCNLVGLSEESFSKINNLEKFYIENSTIISLSTSTGNFQEIFLADSFVNLRLLTLKNVHYHQIHKHEKKLNLELLLERFPQLHRIELVNIHLDNYRHNQTDLTNRSLTYLRLINTHQSSLLPIEHLSSLESLIIVHLPEIFRHQRLIESLKNLKHLAYIDFSHNQITNIDNLESNSIDEINLRSNLIERIDEYAFENVRKLRTLTLTDNPLKSIDKNAFCGIVGFKRLFINSHATNRFSPLDNCFLWNNTQLEINDVPTKFHCDCQLVFLYNLKRHEQQKVNRLLKLNDKCLVSNRTLDQAKHYQQLVNHLHQPISINELGNFLNCSTAPQCTTPCKERRTKSSTKISTVDQQFSTDKTRTKNFSASTSIDGFISLRLALFLFAFSYL